MSARSFNFLKGVQRAHIESFPVDKALLVNLSQKYNFFRSAVAKGF